MLEQRRVNVNLRWKTALLSLAKNLRKKHTFDTHCCSPFFNYWAWFIWTNIFFLGPNLLLRCWRYQITGSCSTWYQQSGRTMTNFYLIYSSMHSSVQQPYNLSKVIYYCLFNPFIPQRFFENGKYFFAILSVWKLIQTNYAFRLLAHLLCSWLELEYNWQIIAW